MHQPWNELLQQYVDDRGLVDYRGIKRSPSKLTNWLQELATIDPKSLDRQQQMALWLNLYNALVIEQVIDKYPIESILPKLLGIPNWLAFWRFFTRRVYRLNGDRYSLNNIEHDILRPKFEDPRIHFALVCGAIGCPLLRNEAYQGDRLEAQLESDARRFINNPDKVKYDAEQSMLYCSQIFKWYRQDFLKVAPSLTEYIQIYLDRELNHDRSLTIKYLDYDWHLNQRMSS